jgi:hypothetical protein
VVRERGIVRLAHMASPHALLLSAIVFANAERCAAIRTSLIKQAPRTVTMPQAA